MTATSTGSGGETLRETSRPGGLRSESLAARSSATESREWAQIRNALDYYANQWNWDEDDWGVKAVLTGRGGYGNPTEKAKRARDAMRRLETKLNAD